MTHTALLAGFVILSLLSITRAQGRAPHGLINESPIAFSPQAYEFFHPNTQLASSKSHYGAENNSPLPLAATVVQSDVARESRSTPEAGKTGLGAGGFAGIVFGVVSAVILAMGVYYVVITRRTNLNRTKSAQPDV